MDPSMRDEPTQATFTAPSPPPTPTPNDLTDSLNHLTIASAAATPLPASPAALSPSSLLSPADVPVRSSVDLAHPAPRRTVSSNSLRDERDERRKSTSSLKKRSSTASLRSAHNSAGTTSPRPSLSRRSSSSNFATSPTSTSNMPSKKPQEQAAPTAASVAADFFQREVDLHQSTDLHSKVVVVVHDACYGHRFSRPRTSKTALSYIVERPERIQACVVGVSAAYVLMAGRHAGKRFAPHPDLDLHQLPAPPFQIRKTSRTLPLTSAAVTHVHGTKWMDELKNMCDAAESRLALNGKELVRPRSSGKDGESAKKAPLNDGDLYLCSESLNAFQGALGGVCEGVDAVFNSNTTKRAFVCIRPPGHHCSTSHPSGFCWINNVHVGITYAAMTHGLTHAAILDFDLHHGDGSQDIAWEQNQKAVSAVWNAANYKKTRVGYFSLHDINSFPCEYGDFEKVRNASVCIDKAHGQSIWNIHLETWKSDEEFWDIYAAKYTVLLEKARAFLRLHTERLLDSAPGDTPPKAAIFISAGFDASEWEGSGMQRHQVNVPTEFYAKFTADVVQMAQEEGLGVDGRVISVLEGGYSNRALTSGVLSHLAALGDTSTISAVINHEQQVGLASEMFDRLHVSDSNTPAEARRTPSDIGYDNEWWAPTRLEELESLVYPPPATAPKSKSARTYFAPTQSFTAKVVTPPRDRKSTGSQASSDVVPLPEVGWATAAHELSKILIPSHRQTTSYRPEELNAEASRIRRERQTAVAAAHAAQKATNAASAASAALEGNRMQLRTRKTKASLPSSPKAETPKKKVTKSTRRITIDPGDLPSSTADSSPGVRPTRRKSTTPTASKPSGTAETGPNNSSSLNVGASEAPVQSSIAAGNYPPESPSSRRSSTPSRSAAPKRSEGPKVPPVPRVPSGFLSKPATGDDQKIISDKTQAAMTEKTDSRPVDLDDLAAGVKKLSIKLKVPTPEEHAAREKERNATEELQRRAPRPTTSRTPRSSKKASSLTTTAHASTARGTSHPSPSPSISQMPSPPNLVDSNGDMRRVKQESPENAPEELVVSSPDPLAENKMPLLSNVTIDRPRWERPKDVSVSGSASTQERPSGTATPSSLASESLPARPTVYTPPTTARQTMNGLPVLTSSGPIPFAPASTVPKEEQALAMQQPRLFSHSDNAGTGHPDLMHDHNHKHEQH
ncbi:histone deacetylase HOS3 [Aspergillus udagawae]|uniref:Histone deacetylase HOS3 n=1 Tax=Aspergillus udagawae TaxID=91492 RepID=A0ABQ1B014_9EURO|nr:histone deacetylase HOS3 [Aspergillus udagawae]GFG03187.1 histone deacetylase HOS3 [Aspergillus udagawae]GFG24831.1 histone deacetylase HOS3 [Aspergillus udagawae]